MVISNSNSSKGNEWTWVFNGRHKQHKKPIDNPYSKDVERIAKSFYVTNFPNYVDAKRLWQVCEPYGRIVDAYIASKPSKRGKRFGFVRFMGIVNAEEFAKRLANIWIESFHLFAAVARFNRPQSRKVNEETYHPRNRVPTPIDSKVNNLSANIFGAKSFASVVNGGENRNSSDQPRGELRRVAMSDSDLIKVEESTKVALVKVRDVGTMNAVYRLCRSEGFTQIKVHYIGGLWLWIQFEDAASCNAFRNNVAMKNVFSSIKSVSQNFVIDERMIWIEISGLPLCAWGSNAYKRVANVLGKFMFFEIDQDSSLGIGRVCIATKQKSSISENVQVVINGEEYMVRVNEIATWSIKIEDDVVSEEAASDKEEKGDAIEEEESLCDDNVNEIELDQVEVSTEEKQQETEVEEKVTHGEKKQQEKEVEEKTSHVDGDQEGKSYEVETDPSCPPGFEYLKKKKQDTHHQQSCEYSNTSKCSTTFAKYRKKGVRGISMIHEMSRLIDIGYALGYDVRGCRKSLKRLLNESVQESKMTHLELFRLKSMWGNYSFDYACSLARGRSGGIISIWDPAMFIKSNIWCGDHYLIVEVTTGARFKDRLKLLKVKIKEWFQVTKQLEQSHEQGIRNRINELDQKLDTNVATDLDREERLKLMQECEDFERLSSVSVINGPFIDERTTGIEPARGGFTIHCLDPLGYIRPYPRTKIDVSHNHINKERK
ncbi:hypothetical protein CTI12_AA322370 [Artemisia annua]|uniref:RRM domain-containing protein n=1 Tax=Artemisia annua TaxID=35608 RepID=A0A2U1N0A6_ARTAN|nr:hypothetical protein CTI12_AA322370 [Artemisia annua]